LIVALLGLESRIVLQSTYAIVVFMTAVTTVMAPPLLRVLYRGEIVAGGSRQQQETERPP